MGEDSRLILEDEVGCRQHLVLVQELSSQEEFGRDVAKRKKRSEMNLNQLLTSLLVLPKETEWVEFKHNNDNPEPIGEYLSAYGRDF